MPVDMAGLSGSFGTAGLLPGEETVWSLVKAGVAKLKIYQPDMSVAELNSSCACRFKTLCLVSFFLRNLRHRRLCNC